MRNIPENNLAYPVFINIDNTFTGSGFILNNEKSQYLVTAKHVIYNSKSAILLGKKAIITCQIDNINSDNSYIFELDLNFLVSDKRIKVHPSLDVAIIEIFNFIEKKESGNIIEPYPGVKTIKTSQEGKIVTVNINNISMFENVLISNDIYLYGYPSSIGLQGRPQFNYNKPLLRKGIVAGLNKPTKSIILDCPVYFGNSGGPVVQVELNQNMSYTHKIIGVVSEFIPFQEQWVNTRNNLVNTHISNSGYSIAISMDPVLEMLNQK
ncbi:S1 family peptidase [Chryseobacterium aureum]|uniref:S1 family peptidase n=1 Tax=Chryseobacterium aureum TaxID=2497456 RepID=UPI000F872805|nr:serine protease [Chryseobacterium aureum]